MSDVKKSLKLAFNSVVSYVSAIEEGGSTLSPNFYIPGCVPDRVFVAHRELMSTNEKYADSYRTLQSELRGMKDSKVTAWAAKRLSFPVFMAFEMARHPLTGLIASYSQWRMFSAFKETQAAKDLMVEFKDRPYQIINL